MGSESRFGAAAKEYWDDAMRKVGARVAHARGEISDEQLRAALGPPPPPGFGACCKPVWPEPGVAFSNCCRKVNSRPRAGVSRLSNEIT